MPEERVRPGRPRDEAAADTIRQVTLHLLREEGYRGVTIAAIARASGVARQTLYNRWPAKADLVLDALFADAGSQMDFPPAPALTDSATWLEAFLKAVFRNLEVNGRILRALIGAAQEDDAFCTAFRDRFVLPREEMVIRVLDAARARGELSAEADTGALSAMIHGAFWYRLLNDGKLDDGFATAITKSVFAA